MRHEIGGQGALAQALTEFTIATPGAVAGGHKVAEAEEGYEEARSRLERSIDSARGELRKVERSLLENSREALQNTEQYVRRHPWQSVGVGVGIGLVIGALFGRR